MYLKLVACEIAIREFSWAIARAKNQVVPEFLPQGYHGDVPNGLRKIQERIDALEGSDFDAVLLGYALCNNILAGIQARSKPLVIARAHDCITWFFGSKKRYAKEFAEHPGSYYYTTGWLSAHQSAPLHDGGDGSSHSSDELRFKGSYEELVEQYGEDNAQYLWEIAHGWVKNYSYGTFISLPCTYENGCRQQVHEICARNGWEYGERQGDLGLLQRWMDGEWGADEFLVVQPGERVGPTYDDRIISIDRPQGG